MLNSSSASGICPSGNPTSLNPPANPSPCNKPKENATSQGWRSARLGFMDRRSAAAAQNFSGDKNDAEGDHRLYRRLGNMNKAEGGQGQGDAVRYGKGAHGFDQSSDTAHQ